MLKKIAPLTALSVIAAVLFFTWPANSPNSYENYSYGDAPKYDDAIYGGGIEYSKR